MLVHQRCSVNNTADFKALVSDSRRQALQTPGYKLNLILKAFELTEEDSKTLAQLAGLVEYLTLQKVSFQNEELKSSFLEAVSHCRGLRALSLIYTDSFNLGKYLFPAASHPISKFLKRVTFGYVPITLEKAALISRALEHNTILQELDIKSFKSEVSDIVSILRLLRPMKSLGLDIYYLSRVEFFTFCQRVARVKMDEGGLLHRLSMRLEPSHNVCDRAFLKWGGYTAEKGVGGSIRCHMTSIPDEERSFVEYMKKLATFYI